MPMRKTRGSQPRSRRMTKTGAGHTLIGRICTTAAVAIAMMLGAVASANAEAEAKKKDKISDRTVRALMGLAFHGLPQEVKTKDGKTIKIDKSKSEDIIIPLEDSRRVIMLGRMSAYAQACDLPALQLSNYRAFMLAERKKEKWSHVQFIYMHRLHLYTLALMTGQLETVPVEGKGDKKPTTDTAEPSESKSKVKKLTCPPERKEQVRKQIETFVEEVKKTAS